MEKTDNIFMRLIHMLTYVILLDMYQFCLNEFLKITRQKQRAKCYHNRIKFKQNTLI